jgi:hypothetical protein
MNRYRVHLTWAERELPFQPAKLHEWHGIVVAKNADEAIRHAKAEAGAPERATSETQRLAY